MNATVLTIIFGVSAVICVLLAGIFDARKEREREMLMYQFIIVLSTGAALASVLSVFTGNNITAIFSAVIWTLSAILWFRSFMERK